MVRRLRLTGAFALALALFGIALPPRAGARPNVVVVVTDDQTLQAYNDVVMPKTVKLLGGHGTEFAESIVATPQCCPSRAGYLTGQYPQNNHVTANRPGYPMLEDKRDVLPNWLRTAGYRTIHIGKYLNGYTKARGARPGPGWDRWLTLSSANYQQPVWSVDGRFRADHGRYLTSTINRMAKRTVGRYAERRRPFYLQVDHLAPHVGALPATGPCKGAAIPQRADTDLFANAHAPRNHATDEADVGDKPEFIRRNPPLGPAVVANADRFYGCALASLRSVDRGIAGIVAALRRAGELDRTMIAFTSDNGLSYLEHRMPLTKGLPYEEHVRVPLVIRPPHGFPNRWRSGAVTPAPVANIDLAPTILRLAGATPCRAGMSTCRRMDGRSLLPLMRGRQPNWTSTRAIRMAFFINSETYIRSCRWDGLRTPRHKFVNHVLLPQTGGVGCEPADEYEYYNLAADPFELAGDAPIPSGFDARLERLRHCSGIRGRDPHLAGTPFCE